jgi:hypothetical protein
MNELTFLRALSNGGFRKEAGVGNFARAALGEVAKAVRDHAPEIGAALVGAVALGGGQYLMSRPRDGGKAPSLDQLANRAIDRSSKDLEAKAKLEHRPLSFREGTQAAIASAASRVADVGARHPGTTALMAAPVGATAALALLRFIRPPQ